MCVGIPMQVLETGNGYARCRGRNGEATIDMRLIGEQPQGTWILTFTDAAREVLEPERAAAINKALDALESLRSGQSIVPADLDAFFPDLAGREPQLPDFLKTGM